MSSELDRNPSPPPGILSDEELLPDRIADTVYSKRWTIKTLMNIVQASHMPDEKESSKDFPEIVELDPNIEEDACTLWDMSASKPVAEYLVEFGVWEIFLDIIHRTKSPRLLEIIIGILGNVCTYPDLCQKLSENEDFINTVLILSGTIDAPSLIQLFRLIRCGIKFPNCQLLWFKSFEKNTFFMENVKYIISDTLNYNLVKTMFQFLLTLVTENVNYCEIWGQDCYLAPIIIAAKMFSEKECLDIFFLLLHSICSCTSVIKAVVEIWPELEFLFKLYADILVMEESLFDSNRLSAVYSYFDVYITLLNDPSMKPAMVSDVNKTSFARILASVKQLIANMKRNNLISLQSPNDRSLQSDDSSLKRIEQRNGSQYITMMSREEFNTWECLASIIIKAAETRHSFISVKENIWKF